MSLGGREWIQPSQVGLAEEGHRKRSKLQMAGIRRSAAIKLANAWKTLLGAEKTQRGNVETCLCCTWMRRVQSCTSCGSSQRRLSKSHVPAALYEQRLAGMTKKSKKGGSTMCTWSTSQLLMGRAKPLNLP
jgi:hypothetical protein